MTTVPQRREAARIAAAANAIAANTDHGPPEPHLLLAASAAPPKASAPVVVVGAIRCPSCGENVPIDAEFSAAPSPTAHSTACSMNAAVHLGADCICGLNPAAPSPTEKRDEE